jgi:hypothetical protein
VESGDNCVFPPTPCAGKLNEKNECILEPVVECDEGELRNEKGDCVCPEGYEHTDVAKTKCGLIACKINSYRDPFTGTCFCDNGFETDDYGNCI